MSDILPITEIINFSTTVIENQGFLAFLLLVVIYDNRVLRKELMHKVCKLETFIMDCYKQHLLKEEGKSEDKTDSLPDPFSKL